ncbi:enhancer of mRNA-decapping protein 4-like isoform X2 [Ptychodera flava]|uniref:enhancer of mRNA-decapping protein 4-like isoform X2 n=1 Tax=Ptychodera flava TaxID=63121 RepID=UPI003969C015
MSYHAMIPLLYLLNFIASYKHSGRIETRVAEDSSLQSTTDAVPKQATGDRSGTSTMNGTSSSQQIPNDGSGEEGTELPVSLGTAGRSAGEITTRQQILLQGSDRTGSVPIYAKDVTIVESEAASVANTTAGSSKVKISPVTNYDWELKYYTGNLVAINNTYVAYALKGRDSYVVRVINFKTSDRVLLKGFSGVVIDLAFGHLNSNTLACIDEQGNLFVWDLAEQDSKIIYNVRVIVKRPPNTPYSEHHRVIWCPYIPEDLSDTGSSNTSNADDDVRLLAITHDQKAEVWDLDVVAGNHGDTPVSISEVKEGVITIDGHDKPISQAALSPDGAVLATASLDGSVKFWQVYLESSDPPRRLHQWTPHGGRPVSCLLFCDNHKFQDPNLPFWRFLLTGADFNREIKVWCTVSWTCLQTLQFLSPSHLLPDPCMKAVLDLSAGYLVMSDIKRKVLYVLEVFQDVEKGYAHISSISEFLLTLPMLSFAVLDAGRKKFKHLSDDVDEDADPDVDEDDTADVSRSGEKDELASSTNQIGVVIKMYCVHTKALQELQVRFKPQSSVMSLQEQIAASISTISQDEIGLRDPLSDLDQSTDVEGSQSDLHLADNRMEEEDDNDQAPTPTPGTSMTSSFTSESARSPHHQPVLLPPGAFTSTTPKQSPQQILRESQSSTSSLTAVSGINSSIDDMLSTEESHNISESTVTLTPSTHRMHELSDVATPSSLPLPPITPSEASTSHSQEIDIDILEKSALEGEHEEQMAMPQMETTTEFNTDPHQAEKRDSSSSIELVGNSTPREDISPEIEIVPEPGDDDTQTLTEDVQHSSLEDQGNNTIIDKAVKIEQDSSVTASNNLVSQETKAGGSGYQETLSESSEARVTPVHLQDQDDKGSAGQASSISNQPDIEVSQPVIDTQQLLQKVMAEQEPKSEPSDHESAEVASISSSSSVPGKDKIHKKEMRRERRARGSPRPKKIMEDERAAEVTVGLKQLMSMIQSQQQEIKQLRQDIQKHQLNNSLVQTMKSKMDSLERRMGSKIDTAMAQQSQEERHRLDMALSEKQTMDKQKQEKLLETVSQTLSTTITQKLEKTVKVEMKNSVVPAVNRVVEPLKEQLHQSVAQKLTATDSLMKENIGKLVRARSTTEAIGQAAANTVQNAMQSTFKDTFQSSVVPAFDKACQSMFQQINETFQSGTQEYMQQLDNHLEKRRQQIQEGRDPLLDKLQSMVDSFQASSTQIRNSVVSSMQAELDNQLQKSMDSLQSVLVNKVRDIVKDEVNHAMKDHQAVVESSIVSAITRSSAATPVPSHIDTQQLQMQLVQMIQQGQFNTAFQTALSASDLSIVVFVCQTVQPHQVFSPQPCPLNQPVILSLVQQLSAELENDTELKQKYLEEAVMTLDPTDPVAREHMPGVVMGLVQKIQIFVQNYPQHEMTRPLRRVAMLAQSLLK